jgi:hypothetical protein
VPACASLSIAAVADQVGEIALSDPVVLAPSLQTALAGMVDPRERRGIRHGLTVVLTATVCAVAAGARSFVAVAEWVADLPTDLAVVLGVDRRCPSESAIRRLIGKVDADRFDTVIGVSCKPSPLPWHRPGGAACSPWTASPCGAPGTSTPTGSPARAGTCSRYRPPHPHCPGAGRCRRQDQ